MRDDNAGVRESLRLHPDSRCMAATDIDVVVGRPRPNGLVLRYLVTGNLSDLRLPSVTAPARGDELWRHTCFEAFVRASASAAYYELNFSPSTRWAAYRFSDYRSGMEIANEMGPPQVEVRSNGTRFELHASLEMGHLPGLPPDEDWRLGVAAVIEETSGRKSYWALAHPPGQADFHHSDGFAHKLPARKRP